VAKKEDAAMPTPPIIFDPEFVPLVAGGYGLALLGAVLLLAAGIWWARASNGVRLDPKPPAWRALAGAGWLCFVLGILWQLVGYVRIGVGTWLR
jgi:drug/metabolite transporter (DMT)-like permease